MSQLCLTCFMLQLCSNCFDLFYAQIIRTVSDLYHNYATTVFELFQLCIIIMPLYHNLPDLCELFQLCIIIMSLYHNYVTFVFELFQLCIIIIIIIIIMSHLCLNCFGQLCICLLYTSPSPRDSLRSRMPSSA